MTKTDFYRKTVFSNISVTNLYLVSLYLQKSDQREIGLLNHYRINYLRTINKI